MGRLHDWDCLLLCFTCTMSADTFDVRFIFSFDERYITILGLSYS